MRAKLPNGTFLTGEDWLFFALRGLQDTLESRVDAGLLFVSQDVVKSFHDRPAKQRSSKPSRPIPQRENPWPEGRKLVSRPLSRNVR